MLRLDLHREPVWLDLAAGVRVCLAPLTTALMVSARNDPAVEALGEDVADEDRALVFAKAIARRALIGWEGVGDADGEPVDPTFEGIDALLDIYPVFEAFQLKYVNKGLLLDAEKNGSAPSPNGTSAEATDTAKPARRRARTARAA
jgi:hypothetical protein